MTLSPNIDKERMPYAMDLIHSAEEVGSNISQQYNDCSKVAQDLDREIRFHHILYEILVPVVFSIIAAVGLFGNLLVIYTIVRKDQMHTSLNVLLVNLAASDLLFLLICVPFTAYHYSSPTWSLGEILCNISPYPFFVAFYVTMYTLVFISAWRYVTVSRHPRPIRARNPRTAIIASILIWITAAAVNIPTLFMFRVAKVTKKCWEPYEFCGETNKVLSNAVYMTFLVAGYIGPLLVMSGLYLALICYVKSHAKIERTHHVTRLILLVVLAFFFCWLPLQVHMTMAYFSEIPDSKPYHIYRLVCHCLAFTNSCMNPFIYSLASKPFRDSFKESVTQCRRNPRPTRLELSPLQGQRHQSSKRKEINSHCYSV